MATSTVAHPSRLVIVVDDDDAVREALTFSLEMAHLRVRAISSAEDLFDGELPLEPFGLVIDQRLPNMPGLSAIREPRRRGTKAPAVIITTLPSADLRAAAEAEGVQIVEKPLIDDALVSAIHAMQF
jgi:FixJ family two-component response regulator